MGVHLEIETDILLDAERQIADSARLDASPRNRGGRADLPILDVPRSAPLRPRVTGLLSALLPRRARAARHQQEFDKPRHCYDFHTSIWLVTREVLREASYGKCAYCESQSDSTRLGEIDHYWPKHRAEGLRKGEIYPDHYWWLAYSWDNLVFCCQACNRAKRNRFPVIGKRLESGNPSGAEQPLLLDPYSTHDPSEHLWFEEDGTVRPISDRGDVTIQVLALNRPGLVERRREAAELTQSVLAAAPAPVPGNTRAARHHLGWSAAGRAGVSGLRAHEPGSRAEAAGRAWCINRVAGLLCHYGGRGQRADHGRTS
jgi:uncharacterized protein (TIGR02646 family)